MYFFFLSVIFFNNYLINLITMALSSLSTKISPKREPTHHLNHFPLLHRKKEPVCHLNLHLPSAETSSEKKESIHYLNRFPLPSKKFWHKYHSTNHCLSQQTPTPNLTLMKWTSAIKSFYTIITS